jgi:AmmeMemoRadiSam system protein A
MSALPALARHAIAEKLGRPGTALPTSLPTADYRGVFVTLRRRVDNDLRGCVGIVEPRFPLDEAVRRAAVSAALEDTRFPPVTLAELPLLTVDVSVLGPLAPSAPEDVEVGRHGVVVRHDERSALLLPQVATEQGWDRETLLRQLCRKAGLAPDAWRHPECRLFVFESETFSE